jgi:hypothetical protein
MATNVLGGGLVSEGCPDIPTGQGGGQAVRPRYHARHGTLRLRSGAQAPGESGMEGILAAQLMTIGDQTWANTW